MYSLSFNIHVFRNIFCMYIVSEFVFFAFFESVAWLFLILTAWALALMLSLILLLYTWNIYFLSCLLSETKKMWHQPWAPYLGKLNWLQRKLCYVVSKAYGSLFQSEKGMSRLRLFMVRREILIVLEHACAKYNSLSTESKQSDPRGI